MARTRLNGVDIERIQAMLSRWQQHPDLMDKVANSVWKSRVMWRENFHASAFAREMSPLDVDQPDWLMGDNRGFSPHELVLSALGASIAVAFVAGATALGVGLDMLEIEVAGELDLPAIFGISGGTPGYRAISVTIDAKSDAPPEVLEMLQEKAMSLSPVADTLRRPVRISVELRIVEGTRHLPHPGPTY